ncbi:MAG TPA: hypothetical protein VIV58_05485, partial [Kofleriaceae bacterium]
AAPDIDCYRMFATDAEAATWWSATEKSELGQTYPIVPESDPRFARVRAALDKGWAAFKVNRPVGKLADARPALVLVDQPFAHAAFVYTDTTAGNQPFAVMVETPALATGATDDALLGVMMHELQHAVGLHNLGDNATKIQRYYAAPAGQEPFGRDQTDDANLRELAQAWMEAASSVGPYSQVELGGLPLAGDFQTLLAAAVGSGKQNHAAACTPIAMRIDQITQAVVGAEDPLDASLPADLSGVDTAVAEALDSLATDCLGDFPYGVIEVGASVAGITPAQFEMRLQPHDVELVKGVPFVAGLTALVEDRRDTMRAAEGSFAGATGDDWSRLRYFSVEEDADDVSTMVMHGAGLDPTSVASFFRAVLPAEVGTACEAALPFPGYGVDLTDPHHAVCWRIGHVQRESDTYRARTVVRRALPATVRRPGKWPKRFDPRSQIMD